MLLCVHMSFLSQTVGICTHTMSESMQGQLIRPARFQCPTDRASALHSEMWKILGLLWKIVVLDEAQRVNKRDKLRHQALKHLRVLA